MASPGHVHRKGERRSLSHVGGAIEVSGADDAMRAVLEKALAVESDERATRAHVHGFHSFAARLHPGTARALVEGLAPPGGRVLDPFCGSGTVLVEARLAGRHGFGIDANPLAVEIAWLKSAGSTARERERLVASATEVAEHADLRRSKKAGPTRRYGPDDRDMFDVHVLLELDGLVDGIRRSTSGDLARALGLVLSSILVKVSRQPGDTTETRVARRLPGGFSIELFVRRAEELARQLGDYAALLGRKAPPANIAVGDARRLERVDADGIDLVVSSPPYPGVYDYATQHAARLRWLGLDARHFERSEIGSRRQLGRLPYAAALVEWRAQLGPCLAEMARVLAPQGRVALVIADSVLAGRPLYADALVPELASRAGLALTALASQPRPHFHLPTERAFAKQPRHEHVLVLRRV